MQLKAGMELKAKSIFPYIVVTAVAMVAIVAIIAVTRSGALRFVASVDAAWTPAAAAPSPAPCQGAAPPAVARQAAPQHPAGVRQGC